MKNKVLGWAIVITLTSIILIFKFGNPKNNLILLTQILLIFSFICMVPFWRFKQNKKNVLNTENNSDIEKEFFAGCGHKTKIKGNIWTDSKPYQIKFKTTKADYCIECHKKAVIICPWCKGPIFPVGEQITLNTPAENNYKIPEGTIVFKEKPLQLVGCARCADTGADYAGYWIMPGKVLKQKSLLEIAAETGGVVMSNNLANPNEPVSVFKEENGKIVKFKVQR